MYNIWCALHIVFLFRKHAFVLNSKFIQLTIYNGRKLEYTGPCVKEDCHFKHHIMKAFDIKMTVTTTCY